MAYVNPYFHSSKLPEYVFRAVLEGFACDFTATRTADLTGISVRSVNTIFLRMRTRIAAWSERQWCLLRGDSDAPEAPSGLSLLSASHLVLGLFDRCGILHVEIVPAAMKGVIQDLIRGQVSLQSLVEAGRWPGYDSLLDLEFERFLRIVSPRAGELDRTETFWEFMADRLRKFHGVPAGTFHLHMKECEFRFNHQGGNLLDLLLELLGQDPL